MSALRLATFVLWTVGLVLAVLGMIAVEDSEFQYRVYGLSIVCGGVGLITLVLSLA